MALGDYLKLLVIQSAYSYNTLCERNLLDFATSKELQGFFKTVFTVHPAATVEFSVNTKERYGRVKTYRHSPSHIFIEARIGRSWHLRKFPLLNFVLSQVDLLIHLLKLLHGEKYMLIRAEDPRYNGLLGFLLTRIKGLPFIVGTWGNPDRIRKFTSAPIQPRVFKSVKLEVFCEKFLLKRADCVLVQNEDNFNYAVQYGAAKESVKYFRLGNAVYPEHFVEPGSRTLSTEVQNLMRGKGYKVCTVSRLETLKIVDHTIRSFAEMKNSSESHLYILGDGSQRNSLLDLTCRLSIRDRVHFLGNINQQFLAEILPQMDLVLAPSMGRALTEAALAAVPIVAYDTDCHPEIVKTGETGILVKYLDFHAMAENADYILENPNIARQMGQAARDWTLKFMNPDKLIQEQRFIFLELVKMAYKKIPS